MVDFERESVSNGSWCTRPVELTYSKIPRYLMGQVEWDDHNEQSQHYVQVELPMEVARPAGTQHSDMTTLPLHLDSYAPLIHDPYNLKYDELKHGTGEGKGH